jgi:hypothetical protein
VEKKALKKKKAEEGNNNNYERSERRISSGSVSMNTEGDGSRKST